jgi:GT2 family glycosyltransferase
MSEIVNTFVFPIVRRDFVVMAIKSLCKFTPPNFKVIIIDQTQYDQDLHEELWGVSDIVIKPHVNWGFSQAANIGTRLATTPWVTVCNDDVEFFWDGWWDGVMETFQRFETALGVCPMSPKEPGWGYGEEGYRIHATLEECQELPHSTAQRLKDQWAGAVVDGFAAWCVTLRREPWIELGMFDERFMPGGGEDYDVMARAYQSGYRMLATSLAWVWHYWGQSKDEPGGFKHALPNARPGWNKLSTKGFGDEGLWHPDVDCWGRGCTRTDPEVYRAPL